MAEADATQCGFCTPGFVMSAYAFATGGEKPDLETIHDALAGNLCRCTGYRPIVEAMGKVAGLLHEPASPPPARTTSATFDDRFFAPRSLADLLALRARHPEALLLAGATDLGLLASRARTPPRSVIHLAHVPELTMIAEGKEEITIGAAVAYARAMPVLIAAFPALRTYLARLGSRQIRTLGTIGGNVGTASPIGDMPPVCWRSGLGSSSCRCAGRASCRWKSSSSTIARRRWRRTRSSKVSRCRACRRAKSSSATR